MAKPFATRLSVEPLIKYVCRKCEWVQVPTEVEEVAFVAGYVGMTKRAVQRWRTEGIPESQVDRICTHHLGVHPTYVYGDEWEDLARVAS